MKKNITQKGFTLVELLVVIAIIAVLVSILIPAFTKAKMQARLVLCANNQHQILLGLKQYQADYNMKLPPTIQGMYYQGEYWEPPYYITHYADPVHPRYAIRMGGGSIGLQLGRYLPDSNIFACPASPLDTSGIWGTNGETYQEIYRTGIGQSRMFTSYWIFWNYGGWVEQDQWSQQMVNFRPFDGEDTLMLADQMFYYPHQGSRWFLNHKLLTRGTLSTHPMYWIIIDPGGDTNYTIPEVFFNAGYLDGHVEKYAAEDSYEFNMTGSSKWYIPSKWR